MISTPFLSMNDLLFAILEVLLYISSTGSDAFVSSLVLEGKMFKICHHPFLSRSHKPWSSTKWVQTSLDLNCKQIANWTCLQGRLRMLSRLILISLLYGQNIIPYLQIHFHLQTKMYILLSGSLISSWNGQMKVCSIAVYVMLQLILYL